MTISPVAPVPRILVVDDESANVEVLVRRLGVRRFHVLTANCGEAALRVIREERPELVLLDVMMPGLSGIEVLAEIRKLQSVAELPVIMLTAKDDKETMLAAIGGGANDYMTKPIDFDLLLVRMAVQLRVRAAFHRAVSEQARLQRRLDVRARLEEMGLGDTEKRTLLMNELHRGMGEGQVQLLYQPKLRLRSGAVDSAEALMRWNSPSLGPIPADQFIPLAEETGDVRALTEWALTRAIEDHQRLAKSGHKIRFALNLSASLVCDYAFTDHVLGMTSAFPEAISLELTESAILDNPAQAIENLKRFAVAGIKIAIDDYGTGLSSLSYIQRLPVHEIKIDRMFISKLTSSHRDPLLVRSTIELAHALDLEVVAEGIENSETLALLAAMGCDAAQGYFIGKPMTIDDLTAYLGDETKRPAPPFDARAFLNEFMDAQQRSIA